MIRFLSLLLVVFLAVASPPIRAQASCYDFVPVDGIMNDMVRNGAPAGAVLSLHKDGIDLYERAYGGATLAEVAAVASATKWLSAACLMTLVDDGLLGLDDRASDFLPSFVGAHGRITIRQMLSHTSGLPDGDPVISQRGITLAQSVDIIATIPLLAPPGTQFVYGGLSFQVAGRIAEVVTGQSWARLFDARVAAPMALADTDYNGLGVTRNWRIAGGAQSSTGDLATFVRMLSQQGVHVRPDGSQVRILTAASVEEMFRDQTGGVPIVTTPAPDLRRYGLGCWRDRVSAQGDAQSVSSPGAFGCTPWIDLERGLAGVVLVRTLRRRVLSDIDRLLAWSVETVHFAGVRCFGATTPNCAAAIALETNAPPVAGDGSFALTVRNAPELALGAMLFSDRAMPSGLPVLGLGLYVGVVGTPFSVPLAAALDGTARVSASLLNTTSGVGPVFAQSVWVRACGTPPLPLRASHAIAVRVR